MYKSLCLSYVTGIALFCSISGNFLFSQAEQTELYKNYVIINENAARIKSSKIKTLYEVYTENGKSDTLRYAEFDPNGYILKEIIKTDSLRGSVYKNNTYIYKEGRLAEKIDSSGTEVKRHYISYDEMGMIEKEEIKTLGKTTLEIEYEYDNLGRLIESDGRDIINKCRVTISYAYDSYNNLAKESIKDECRGSKEKPVNTTYSYKYDNKYRIIEKQAIYPNAGYKVISYQYGPSGEVISSYESEGSDTFENIKFTYDEKTNTIQVEKNEVMGDLTRKITGTIQNDKAGNRLEEKYFDSNSALLYTIKNIYRYY